MKELAVIGLKALAGGGLVVAFALVSRQLKPRTLSGIFSAAPSVALASLALTAVAMSSGKAAQAAHSMVAGAVGMVAFCAVAMLVEQKAGSMAGSALAWLAWAVAAGAAFWMIPH